MEARANDIGIRHVAGGALESPVGNSILRHSPWDGLLVALTFLHGLLLLSVPSVPLVGVGLWWSANTVSHNFIHLPFFRARSANVLYSAFLSLLLGLPQSLWKAKHLAHHRDQPFRWLPLRREWVVEGTLVILSWAGMAAFAPRLLLAVYLPGWLIGLALCELHGRLEHAHGTLSHYGWLYNRLFFNDGYHVEHHAKPALHWTTLARSRTASEEHVSQWPAVLRWLEWFSLDGLEHLVCHSPSLQKLVLRTHARALSKALSSIAEPRRVIVVGGGLFPRTALILQRLVPRAELILIDARSDRLERANLWLHAPVKCLHEFCTVGNLKDRNEPADLVIVPLALRGGRSDFYDDPPAPNVLVHDWLWRPRGQSIVVSWLLLKRVNLITTGKQSA